MGQHFGIRASTLLLALALPLGARAGVFEDGFNEAKEAAEKSGGSAKADRANAKAEDAAGQLDTADTIKTTADYVGLAATTATIGAKLYDWVAVDDKKLKELDQQYQQALANGNTQAAEGILAQINQIKSQKRTQAKSQADTQNTLGTIQTVAGVSNIGAGAVSFVSAYMGYDAASSLKEGRCANMKVKDPTKAAEEKKKCIDEDKQSKIAMEKSKSAAKTAIYYGAGEMIIGAGSLYLAKEHKDEAKKLKSLGDDPYAGYDPEGENVLYDRLAATKCGAGKPYTLDINASAPVTNSGTRTATGGAALTVQQQYASDYAKITCVIIPVCTGPGCDPTTPTPTPVTDRHCTLDAFRCPDGSFTMRDLTIGCRFKPCPSSTSTASTASTSGASRAPAEDGLTSGASRMPVGDFGPVEALP